MTWWYWLLVAGAAVCGVVIGLLHAPGGPLRLEPRRRLAVRFATLIVALGCLVAMTLVRPGFWLALGWFVVPGLLVFLSFGVRSLIARR